MINFFTDNYDFANAAANYIIDSAKSAIAKQGRFSLALSGGNTPVAVYKQLVNRQIMWNAIHLFWGDERCVPPSDARSNFNSAYNNLIGKIKIPEKNIHAIPFITKPEQAAREYEKNIKLFFKSDIPSFDLILLGIGTDGHTASLFPKSNALKQKNKLVVNTETPPLAPRVERITFTFPLINNAKKVLFLVGGKNKMNIVDEIINHPEQAKKKYPAAMVNPKTKPDWMIVT